MSAGIEDMRLKSPDVNITRYADMLTAMGTEPRLRTMRLLLWAHPAGLVIGNIQKKWGLTASNLSHHLEKLKNKELVVARRDGAHLSYLANVPALEELLGFLCSECCIRNRVFSPDGVVQSKN